VPLDQKDLQALMLDEQASWCLIDEAGGYRVSDVPSFDRNTIYPGMEIADEQCFRIPH
jgi:hypothetical protein